MAMRMAMRIGRGKQDPPVESERGWPSTSSQRTSYRLLGGHNEHKNYANMKVVPSSRQWPMLAG